MNPILAAVSILTAVVGLGLVWHFGTRTAEPPMSLGNPLPVFSLPSVEGIERPGFSSAALTGKLTVINVFASWCGPCRQEHPLLVGLKRDNDVRLIGINMQDLPENAAQFLADLGNPFDAIGADPNKQVGNSLGIVGLPHTFVVDAQGRLVFSYSGPLTPEIISSGILGM